MNNDTLNTALEAIRQGYQPVPIMDGTKRPYGSAWNKTEPYTNDERGLSRAREFFEKAQSEGAHSIGLRLGKISGGLIDIDLDHHLAIRLSDYFLPPTGMETGRTDSPRRHRWYLVEEDVPTTRKYKLPSGEVSVELRSDGAQTVIPPSEHPSGEHYAWDCEPFGGDSGPARVNGRVLSLQVATLAMASVLLENFPEQGSRHEAYLNLAGGLLRYGDTVHEFWETNLPTLITAIADLTHDDEAHTRVGEVIPSTIQKIRAGQPVGGFPKLAEIIGTESAEALRRASREVESIAGYVPDAYASSSDVSPYVETSQVSDNQITVTVDEGDSDEIGSLDIPASDEDKPARNPMEERVSTWESVDLTPYLLGEIELPKPSILSREDGASAFYPGRVNMIYGSSESAKSWIAMHACIQEMKKGERTVYIDLEDEPVGTLNRMKLLGATSDDIQTQFRYLHPESPLAPMQRGKYGSNVTETGKANDEVFRAFLKRYDPTLIIVDGMTVLYGMHGHDTNDAAGTNVITDWLKSLTRGGRTAVIIIDHTGKNAGSGSSPIGAHHKIAMVQGSAIRADAIEKPMPGEVGRISLFVYKDRPGAVREKSMKNGNSSEQLFASVVLDSTQPDRVRLSIEPSKYQIIPVGSSAEDVRTLDAQAKVEENAGMIVEYFKGDLSAKISTSEVVKSLGMAKHEVYPAWKYLIDEGVVIKHGTRKSVCYQLADPSQRDQSDMPDVIEIDYSDMEEVTVDE